MTPDHDSLVVVTPGYPPDLGGVEGHVHALCTRWAAAGHAVTVLTASRSVRRTTTDIRGGVKVITHPAWRSRLLSLSPRLLWAAWRIDEAVGVVHVHSYHASTGLAMLAARPGLVFTPHFHGGGHSVVARMLHLGYRRIARRIFAHAEAIICVSAAEESQLHAEHPVTRGLTRVIPNGADVERVRTAEPFADMPPTIVSLGRLEAYKRIELLIAAMAHVPEPAQLLIIGDGPHRAELQRLARQWDVADRVEFAGRLSDDDVARWLRTAAVLGSMSDHEAFGMAPIEAAAGGARCVLSDIDAHREIVSKWLHTHATVVDTKSGSLPDVTARVAEALTTALAAERAGPAPVPSWDDVADSTLEVLEEARNRS